MVQGKREAEKDNSANYAQTSESISTSNEEFVQLK